MSMLLEHGPGGFWWPQNAGTKTAMGNAETVPEIPKTVPGTWNEGQDII